MKSVQSLTLALALMFMAGTAMASGCPHHIAQIDQLIQSTELSSEDKDTIQSLRDQGEEAHNDGNHEEAMNKLGEALEKLADA